MKIERDKILHFYAGALISTSVLSLSLPIVLGILLSAALGKEAYDYLYNKITKTTKHGVELMDVVATLAGGSVGLVIFSVIKYLIN